MINSIPSAQDLLGNDCIAALIEMCMVSKENSLQLGTGTNQVQHPGMGPLPVRPIEQQPPVPLLSTSMTFASVPGGSNLKKTMASLPLDAVTKLRIWSRNARFCERTRESSSTSRPGSLRLGPEDDRRCRRRISLSNIGSMQRNHSS